MGGEKESSGARQGMLFISLPLPPGINEQYATVNGRRVLSAEARRFKAGVRSKVESLSHAGRLPTAIIEVMRSSYLALFIDFYFKSPMKRDLDGGLKIAQDALCESLGINDNRVVDIHLVKRIDPLNPRIDVTLETIQEEDWRFDDEYIYISTPQATDQPQR